MDEFHNQMWFLVESSSAVSISTGDLLLTTSPTHICINLASIMRDGRNDCYITAVSGGAVNGYLCPMAGALNYVNPIPHVTKLLKHAVHKPDDGWQAVPQSLWPEIYEFVYGQVY